MTRRVPGRVPGRVSSHARRLLAAAATGAVRSYPSGTILPFTGLVLPSTSTVPTGRLPDAHVWSEDSVAQTWAPVRDPWAAVPDPDVVFDPGVDRPWLHVLRCLWDRPGVYARVPVTDRPGVWAVMRLTRQDTPRALTPGGAGAWLAAKTTTQVKFESMEVLVAAFTGRVRLVDSAPGVQLYDPVPDGQPDTSPVSPGDVRPLPARVEQLRGDVGTGLLVVEPVRGLGPDRTGRGFALRPGGVH